MANGNIQKMCIQNIHKFDLKIMITIKRKNYIDFDMHNAIFAILVAGNQATARQTRLQQEF